VPATTPCYIVKRSRIKGKGVFAARAIRKGARVLEYTGERITPEEADARYDDERRAHAHVVLFIVDGKTVIDGGADGGDARFVNHSCEPNCEAVQQRGRIFIRALRAIRPGEELCYDYGLEREGKWQPEWDRLYACRCGAAACRGTMLARRRR